MLLILVLACRIKTEVPFDEPVHTDTADTDAGDTDTADGDSDACVPTDELCNDVDDDCDGLVDEEDDSLTGASIWYADADGDGYGDAAGTQAACAAPPGTVADSTDCDDAEAETNPDATEVCDDLDNDCDGLVDGQDDSLVGASVWYADADGDVLMSEEYAGAVWYYGNVR